MRKITSLFALLLTMLALPASAQLDELKGYKATMGEAAETLTPDTQWYLVYQTREYTTEGGGYIYDKGSTLEAGVGTIMMSEGTGVFTNGMTATAAAPLLLRFLSTDTEGQYIPQFGTGNYISYNSSIASKYDADTWRIYTINDVAGHFGMNIVGSDMRIDNNGSGASLSPWGTGTITTTGGNNDWTFYPVTLTEIDPREEAIANLESTYATYIQYQNSFTTGTERGCYSAEAVAAFDAALETAAQIDEPDSDVANASVAELEAYTQAIIDAYNAVLASRVPYASEITPGYYFIRNGVAFYETTTTEDYEDEDTGETIAGETITTYYKKGLYTDGSNLLWATLDESNVNYLWKVEATDTPLQYTLINCGKDNYIGSVATSTNIAMTSTNVPVVFDYAGTTTDADNYGDENVTFYDIRLNTQAERGYYYVHAGGHSAGAGKSGNAVGWASNFNNGPSATEWALIPVDETIATALIEGPAKQIAAMKDSVQTIIDAFAAQKTIAKDESTELNENAPVITEASQFTSPWTETTEGSVENLFDGNSSTYWHSAWGTAEGGQSVNTNAGTNYFVINDAETVLDGGLAVVVTRRPVANDHVTEFTVYGTDNYNANDDYGYGEDGATWTELGVLSLPYGSNTETITSNAIAYTGSYAYYKFVCTASYYGSTSGRGYFHMSEFQVYPATISTKYATTQAAQRADEISAVEEAIASWEALEDSAKLADVQAAFAALNTAYTAWQGVYVDPSDLRTAITNAPTGEGIVIGTNPGQWATDPTATIKALVAEAQAYDEAGQYTPAKSESYVEQLTNAQANVYASANQIETGKWYEIRYATKDEIEANGWSLTPGQADVDEDDGTEYNESLYGKYVTVASLVAGAEDEEGNATYYVVEDIDPDDVVLGNRLFFDEKNDIGDEDLAKFRFVAVGDTAYIIQNKATGLFLKAAGTSGAVRLSVHPSLFNVSAIGYGENLIAGKNLVGESQNNLHAQRDYNMLVTWSSNTAGTSSGLYIEDINEPVASDYEGTQFQMSILSGEYNAFCYPVSITLSEGTAYSASVEDKTVTLSPITGMIPAGVPFIYINGTTEDYESEATDEDYDPIAFTHGYEIKATAGTQGSLVGTYTSETIGAGKIVVSGNTLEISKKSATTSGANSAYIDTDLTEDLDAELTIILSDENISIEDAIQSAIANVSKSGNIYTIDGRFVGKGNLNTAKNMGRGIYVINGVKVAVK